MNTTNFDGQWTRRVIEHFGFGTAQGSSTRGGLRGLAVMARRLEEGFDAAFTIDGPRGPRYVAKPGPVMLARKTGRPIYVFHIGVEKAHTLEKAWDKMQIPHLFSRAVMVSAPLILVSPEADAEELKRKHAEMQAALERVRDVAESWFGLSEAERERCGSSGILERECFSSTPWVDVTIGQRLMACLFGRSIGFYDLNDLLRHKNAVTLSSSDFLHDSFPKKLVNILLGSPGSHF